MDIQVKSVETQGDDVIVTFTDGHKAIFEPYAHGWGYSVEGLRRFHLKQGNTVVCSYNSRLYRSGPMEDEHRIKSLKDGWTQEQVAAYWGAAREYLKREYFDGKQEQRLWYPWKLVCTEGGSDYHRLVEGQGMFLSK